MQQRRLVQGLAGAAYGDGRGRRARRRRRAGPPARCRQAGEPRQPRQPQSPARVARSVPQPEVRLTVARTGAVRQVLFVTNNATKSRAQYAEKLAAKGIRASPGEVYCSAYAAAAYLKQVGFEQKVFVVGMDGIEEELDLAGIEHTGGTSFPMADTTLDEAAAADLDPAIGAIVAGLDTRFTYAKLAHATCLLHRSSSCLFVATNIDAGDPVNGRIIPGAGTLVAALKVAAGREPVVVVCAQLALASSFDHFLTAATTPSIAGKPEQLLLEMIISEHKLDRSKTVMVGDRLDTDVLFGYRGGLTTLLVLSGVTTPELLLQHEHVGGIMPDHVLPSVAALLLD
eukprot:SM000129S26116  [mRNA]  locus=s129:13814:15773:+ [translate_table: standard]